MRVGGRRIRASLEMRGDRPGQFADALFDHPRASTQKRNRAFTVVEHTLLEKDPPARLLQSLTGGLRGVLSDPDPGRRTTMATYLVTTSQRPRV